MGAKEQLLKLHKKKRASDEEKLRRSIMPIAKTDLEKAVAADADEQEQPIKYIEDVTRHGCESGMVSGLIYYHETCAFYEKYNSEIWDLLEEDRENSGEPTILAVIASLRGAANVGSSDQMHNLLAWYGYETAAQHLLDRKEAGADEVPNSDQGEADMQQGLEDALRREVGGVPLVRAVLDGENPKKLLKSAGLRPSEYINILCPVQDHEAAFPDAFSCIYVHRAYLAKLLPSLIPLTDWAKTGEAAPVSGAPASDTYVWLDKFYTEILAQFKEMGIPPPISVEHYEEATFD